jgi:hypothetical protein
MEWLSQTATSKPYRASSATQLNPPIPLPMTTTSVSNMVELLTVTNN